MKPGPGPDSAHDFSYRGTFRFDATPKELWDALATVDLFETWWPWMRDVDVEGDPLTPGSVLRFRIVPPVPYRLTIEVLVTDAETDRVVAGRVMGDLRGTGRLEIEPSGEGSSVETTWNIEVANAAIRGAIRVARPLLLWAQQWAVEASLRGFRRYLAERER